MSLKPFESRNPGFDSGLTCGAQAEELLASTNPPPRQEAATVDSTVEDAGNSPTTTLRAGLLLKYDSSGNNYVLFDSGSDEEYLAAVLPHELDMLDGGSVAVDRYGVMLYKGGVFKLTQLIEEGVKGTLTKFDVSKPSAIQVDPQQ